ncbi:UDP-N-acetylmuramate dehydrogenase [Nocardioides sp. Arc9.136]|uniref:UDP-N-acetylmuramate dehydrogenase n=1 Tax=Nocardioides sp. Arc9.136 TaxID=2996826 RepID=UPI002666C762|nr:UDP-N-acetylmuramate dehydrogenase [Nocardioides sp. Arc9.136]WKN49164.1 UDP-N-acetylmuramate dehydrogenase [Nocardioides sp. Arc9.136]
MPDLLRDHTTLRLGGPAAELVVATSEEELLAALDTDRPVLVLGGGSNLVVADEGFDGRVVKVATTGISADVEDDDPTCGGVLVTVAAGESWDHLVEVAVERGWVGVEAMSGIPGSVGATPVQNVGAYGQEVSQTIASVRVWDRVLRGVRTFANADCGFGYRHSRFKADPGRHVVLSVTFQLRQGTLGAPVQYAELARALGVELGRRAPLREVREAVLALRGGKGMVLDDADPDTWSAGSFFTNPVVPADRVPDGAPAWPAGDGLVKTSAAWLIDHAGFGKGYGAGRVSLSTKHALALTNRGGATTAELLDLAREVRDGVEAAYGIRLVNEPVLVGCEL